MRKFFVSFQKFNMQFEIQTFKSVQIERKSIEKADNRNEKLEIFG